jgi:hypothetical protein
VTPFRREGGRYVADLGGQEGVILVTVVEEARALLDGGEAPGWGGPLSLARVFPAASRDDPELAADFAAMTRESLRGAKSARLGRLAKRLAAGRIELDGEAAAETVAGINDVRLVLAELLHDNVGDLAAIVRANRGDDDGAPTFEGVLAEVYAVLSAVQETLVLAMLDVAERGGR